MNPSTDDPQLAEWRKIAVQITNGDFDVKTPRMRRPPDGSLRKSLIIGLRTQWNVPEVQEAMKYLGVDNFSASNI